MARAGARRGAGPRRTRDRGRDRRHRRGQPDQAPAGGQDAGPAGRPVRGPRRDRVRPVQRRAARSRARLRRRRSGSPSAAGLLLVPHGGELCGPASVAACLDDLHADRIGHGIRAARGPALCSSGWPPRASPARCARPPTSRSASRATPAQVPLRRLVEAGVPVALGADDPLLFGPRLAAQYEIARQVHGFSDAELADLARTSVLGSAAPEPLRAGGCWPASTAGSPRPELPGRTDRGTRPRRFDRRPRCAGRRRRKSRPTSCSPQDHLHHDLGGSGLRGGSGAPGAPNTPKDPDPPENGAAGRWAAAAYSEQAAGARHGKRCR